MLSGILFRSSLWGSVFAMHVWSVLLQVERTVVPLQKLRIVGCCRRDIDSKTGQWSPPPHCPPTFSLLTLPWKRAIIVVRLRIAFKIRHQRCRFPRCLSFQGHLLFLLVVCPVSFSFDFTVEMNPCCSKVAYSTNALPCTCMHAHNSTQHNTAQRNAHHTQTHAHNHFSWHKK